MNLFDLDPKMNIGEENGEFQFQISIKGFVKGGFTFPRSPWMGISKQAKHTITESFLNDKQFHDEADMVANVAKINCLLDFIEATRNARKNTLDVCETGWGALFQGGRNENIDLVMGEVYVNIGLRKINGRKVFAESLLEKGGLQLEKLLKRFQQKMDYDAGVRAEMNYHALKYLEESDPCFEEPFLQNAPSGSLKQCVAPSSKSELNLMEPISIREWWKSLKSLLSETSSPSSKLHGFYESSVWETISGTEFHPTEYNNLASAGLDYVGIVRESVLGNYEIDHTQFKLPLLGPSWVNGTSWTPPRVEGWTNIAPWNIIEFVTKWVAQGISKDKRKGPSKQASLLKAMSNSPNEASHLAFAERHAIKAQWSFFRVNLKLGGDTSIDLGFDPESFENPSQEDCVSGDCLT